MLMIRKYFLIRVISVATSLICERTWSQVTYETCTIQDSYVTSVVRTAAPPLCSVCSKSRRCAHWQSSDGATVPFPHKKHVTMPLKLHH